MYTFVIFDVDFKFPHMHNDNFKFKGNQAQPIHSRIINCHIGITLDIVHVYRSIKE